jgi:hypothetical protein
LMGHCRAATVGSILKSNAHPFSFPGVVGAMNGTFYGSFDGSNDFDTDSEAIFNNIDKAIGEGKDAIEVGLQNSMVYSPKFALTFINKKDSTLNFIRNKERPLHFTYIHDRKTLVWSSTSEMLECILDEVLGIPMHGWRKDDKDPVFTIKEHDLLKVVIGKAAGSATISSKKLTPKVGSAVSYTNPQASYYAGYMGDDDQWDDYVPGDSFKGTTGKSSKVLVKCDDGQYRTKEADARRKGEQTFRPPNTSTSGAANHNANGTVVINYGKGAHKTESTDLSTLDWLNDLVKADAVEAADRRLEKFLAVAFAQTGSKSDDNRPKSSFELKFRLTEGCSCCGTTIDIENHEEVSRVRWWSRESWACGDCYEYSSGDWVRCSIEDDWIEPGGTPVVVH